MLRPGASSCWSRAGGDDFGLYRRPPFALTFGGYTGATRRPCLSVACSQSTTPPMRWTGTGSLPSGAFAAWSVIRRGARPEP